MGRFLDNKTDEKIIINKNIENYNNYVNDKGKFIEGSPTFVTYYSKNNKASTSDIGLNAVTEIVGSNSPIKFNKLEDFPLYNFNEAQLQYNYDEDSGLDVEIEGEAVIVPGTIKPLADDHFSVSYLNKLYLFRVTNVEGSSIGNKYFYKINYTLSPHNIKILEERQVYERYKVNYASIGTEEKSVITQIDATYLDKINKLMNKLRNFYCKYFYNENLNYFLYNDSFYDNYLHHFISKYDLFIETRTFLTNIKIYPAFKVDDLYLKTLYNYVEKPKQRELNEVYSNISEIPISKNDKKCIFSRIYCEYNQSIWLPKVDDGTVNFEIEEQDDLVEILKIFNTDYKFLEDKIHPLLEKIEKYEIDNNRKSYLIIPCFIYILRKLKNKILEL